MPRGDGTGPMGMGPMTGRRAGFCGGSGVAGFMSRAPGLGAFGRGRGGRGGGRGWRNMFYATGLTGWQRAAMDAAAPSAATTAPTAEAEKQFLEGQMAAIQSQLDEVRKRLAELEAKKAGT
jgi:hypothetical protein